MTMLSFDDLPETEVLLEPRRSKGVGLAPASRLTVGGPFATPLDADTADPDDHELRAFIASEASTYAYWLVLLSCTFRGDDGEPFSRASVNLTLLRKDGKEDSVPVAWSMRPASLLQLRPIPWTIRLGMSLKILNVETEWHPGDRTQAAVLALGELEPSPGWEFTKTPASPLLGTQRLATVVRAPRGVETVGELSVDALITRRRFGLVPHTSMFPTGPTKPFRIPPAD
jgi:hypothetical protein